MSWQVLPFAPAALGESPFWHPAEQALYWVDIPGREILRAREGDATPQRWTMPQEPGCIAPIEGGGLAIALRDGFYRARAWNGALELIHRFDHDGATTRCNDGKADPLGRMWVGTMYEPRDRQSAVLHAIDARGGAPRIETLVDGATIANGLAWSPDTKTAYWADTTAHTVWAWDWDAQTNRLANRRVFLQFPRRPDGWRAGLPGYGGRPDGAAVDVEGNYWTAMFEGARILKFSPRGEQLAGYPLPAQCPTMPCFGGGDGRTLYVTTAKYNRPADELQAMPDSGRVFSMRVRTPGLPVNFFRDGR